jgi:predicted enzyme related to lactoylglutathione lyase
MSERDGYQPGVPCWVDMLAPDPAAAIGFYKQVLGWEFDGPGPGRYFVAQTRGRDVAGVGGQPAEGAPVAWNTYVSVSSVDQAAEAAVAAGGQVLVAPFDALPAGRVAVIADPSGAALCVWEPRDRQGAQLVNEPSAWSMSMLHAGDPDASEAFYRQVFGWESEAFGPPGVKLFRLPGYVGGEPQQPVPRDVVAVMAPADQESYWSVDFWVDDADSVADAVARLGGSVVAPPSDAAGMRQAVLADPAGAVFSVTTAPAG